MNNAQTFLVTGAARGIGAEFTRQLLGSGRTVIAWARNPDESKALTQLHRDFPKTLRVQKVDVTDSLQIATAAKEIPGPIDVLINNAGVLLDHGCPFKELTQDQLKKTFEVNVFAPIAVAQALLPQLQRGSNPALINISSLMGSIDDNGSGAYYAYRMSKTAVNMFTKTFSVDFPKITSYSMHPGWVQTDMGGAGAAITPEVSVKGILKVVDDRKHATGSFINYDGKALEW